MPSSHLKVGQEAENTLLESLLAKGWVLVNKNFRYKKSEIDLIMEYEDCLVFIEVKFRKNNRFGYPENFVTEAQKDRIRLAAEFFLDHIGWQKSIRFDIVAMELMPDSSAYQITHFEDAF